MKVSREISNFKPVTITIDSQEELNLLLACLNVTFSEAEKSWNIMEYAGDLDSELHYNMFSKINELFEEEN